MIDFDAATHTYRVNGTEVPSVTQVLQPVEALLGTFVGVPERVLEHARLRGTYAHHAMSLLVREDLDWSSVDPELEPRLRQGERFLHDTGLIVTATEVVAGSWPMRFAGTIDLLASWRHRTALIDFKFTADVPATVGPQTAGYELLAREMFGIKGVRRFCVHLMPERYRVLPLEDTRDEIIFRSALNVYHWGLQHAA